MERVVQVQREGNVATVTMNRPTSLNAINMDMMEGLKEAFERLANDESIQIVVLRGEGRAFSSGGDIKQMLSPEMTERMEELMEIVSTIGMTLYHLPQIVISHVQGAAAGLGLSLALATDLIIAEQSSKVAMNFIGIGLIPDGGGHFFMKERLGVERAKRIIWEGKVLSASEAQTIGLVDEVVPDGGMDEAIQRAVTRLQAAPLLSMMETKRILREGNRSELERIVRAETTGQLKMRQTNDHLEGIEAFVAKRTPQFKGN